MTLIAHDSTCEPTPSQLTTMSPLRILGYADSKPCEFEVDRASPHCQVSSAFLYRNSIHSSLNATGYQGAQLTVLVPSQGGYYMSPNLHFVCSATCTADVVLGADWLASCQVSVAANMLLLPMPETASNLVDGHRWTAEGM